MKIALLGYGTVGSGVYELVVRNKKRFMENYGQEVSVECILVNTIEKYAHLPHFNLFISQFNQLTTHNVDVVIETLGGIETAYEYVHYYLSNGVSVITSNKDLIAEKGNELHELARLNNVQLRYEASVAGGIPILKTLNESLGADTITEICGIVNGTTNFILTKMNADNLSYDAALQMAQELGFAESDPTSDVEGLDSIRKISILTKLGIKVNVDWKKLPVEGITKIDEDDVQFFNEEDYSFKLLGLSKLYNHGIYASVRPVLLNKASKFANIDDEFNAISVSGTAGGDLFFSGKGAGKFPTATSVLGDLVDILQNQKYNGQQNLKKSTLLKYYPPTSNWVVRLVSQDLITLKKLLENNLESYRFKMDEANNANRMYLEVHNFTEESLVNLLQKVSKKIEFQFKHYLIFE